MLEEPRCSERLCRHFQGVLQPDGTEEFETVVCPAYPRGIPDRIAYGDELHLTIQSDQKGDIVYEKR